jgi:hypothetical protein
LSSDVTEKGLDANGQSTGGPLVVDSTHTYADLDELIVNHVQAMARRVEDLMNHDRFKKGTEDDLRRKQLRIKSSFTDTLFRYLLEELRCSQSCEEYVRVYFESQETRSFQPLFFVELEVERSNVACSGQS